MQAWQCNLIIVAVRFENSAATVWRHKYHTDFKAYSKSESGLCEELKTKYLVKKVNHKYLYNSKKLVLK